jgi:DNA-binding Xre family transcriptional regulator
VIYFKLKELAEGKGYSIKRLAKDANVDYKTLHKLKTGEQQGISFPVLERISLTLKCKPGDLFEYRLTALNNNEEQN